MFTIKQFRQGGKVTHICETKYYSVFVDDKKGTVSVRDDKDVCHPVFDYDRLVVENSAGTTVTNLIFEETKNPTGEGTKMRCLTPWGEIYRDIKKVA